MDKFFAWLSFLGIVDNISIRETLIDWHSLEHTLYNMLVHVRHAEPEKFKDVYPELALINAPRNLISTNIHAIQNLSFVKPNFQPVRPKWYSSLFEGKFNITRKGDGANSSLSIADIESYADHYHELFLHNWEVFNNPDFSSTNESLVNNKIILKEKWYQVLLNPPKMLLKLLRFSIGS